METVHEWDVPPGWSKERFPTIILAVFVAIPVMAYLALKPWEMERSRALELLSGIVGPFVLAVIVFALYSYRIRNRIYNHPSVDYVSGLPREKRGARVFEDLEGSVGDLERDLDYNRIRYAWQQRKYFYKGGPSGDDAHRLLATLLLHLGEAHARSIPAGARDRAVRR